MSSLRQELLRAIELALQGDWDAAHGIVQQHEGNANASWIHAILHKIEGDLANSRYWYHRAGTLEHVSDDAKEELALVKTLLARKP